MLRILPTLLLFVLLVTSCSKDELVQPNATSGTVVSPKSAPVVGPVTTDLDGTVGGQQGLDDGGLPKPDIGKPGGGADISDDGEDLSDSEKSRKKRR